MRSVAISFECVEYRGEASTESGYTKAGCTAGAQQQQQQSAQAAAAQCLPPGSSGLPPPPSSNCSTYASSSSHEICAQMAGAGQAGHCFVCFTSAHLAQLQHPHSEGCAHTPRKPASTHPPRHPHRRPPLISAGPPRRTSCPHPESSAPAEAAAHTVENTEWFQHWEGWSRLRETFTARSSCTQERQCTQSEQP